MFEHIFKRVKYLSWYEWLALTLAIILTVSLPIILGLIENYESTISYVLALMVTIFALMATFFSARGRRLSIIFDIIAVVCNGINLIIFAGLSTQPLLGYTLLCFVLPGFIFTFINWGRREKNGIVEGRSLKKKGWFISIGSWISLSLLFFMVRYLIGGFNDADGLEWTNSFIECFSAASIFVLMSLYTFAFKEAWSFWSITIVLNLVLFLTNYLIMGNPNALMTMITLLIDLSLAIYGMYRWKRVIKDNKIIKK